MNLTTIHQPAQALAWARVALTLLLAFGLALIGSGQTTQTVKGRIIDDVTKQPIIGVQVVLLNSSPLVGTVTDVDGYFRMAVPLGRQTLKITFIGYEPRTLSELIITAGKELILNIDMTESAVATSEVTIVGDRKQDKTVTNNEFVTVSGRAFNVEDTKKYAGSLGDPSRMAANFAGVVAGNDSRNDIVVRGNSPAGMLWQIEGMNVANPNHFGDGFSSGGPVNMLNNNTLAKSDFITGAFPASYGNATAGVFDIRLRDGNQDKREFLGQIGFNGFEVGAEGPFSKKSKASYLVNYRYSTLGLLKNIGVDPGTGASTPLYQDLTFKVNIPMKNNANLSIFGVGGFSAIDLLGKDVDTTATNFFGEIDSDLRPRYETAIGGATYAFNLGDKTYIRATAGYTINANRYQRDSLALEEPNQPKFLKGKGSFSTSKLSGVLSVNHKFNAKNTLVGGLYVDNYQVDFVNRDYYRRGVESITRVDIDEAATLSQAYAQWKHRFGPRLKMNLGAHAQHFSLNNQVVIEPRFGASYSLTPNSSLNVGYGLHHQLQTFYTYFLQTRQPDGSLAFNNKKLDFTRAQHVVLGYDNMLTDHVRLKLEGYYQALSEIPVTRTASSYAAINSGANFNPSDSANLVNNGTGTNYGIELTLERFFAKGYYFLVTGSLFDSRYKGSDGIERNTAYNTRFGYNILAGKEWKTSSKGVLALNLRVASTGGRYLTPIDLQRSAVTRQAEEDGTRAFSQRQSAYFRTDLKISYRHNYSKSTLEVAVDLQNVTNNQNVFAQSYNRKRNSISTEYQQGFFPVPLVRYTF